MDSRISRRFMRILAALTLVGLASIAAMAQDDPDPNSPTPLLVTETTSTRALTPANSRFGKGYSRVESQAFSLGSKVVLLVGNIKLMDDEGANAFRIYGQDSLGHEYRFPVVDIEGSPDSKKLYALTVLLEDEIGDWAPPTEDGDINLYLTWRGLASNTVRLGLGKVGGGVAEDKNAAPVPLSAVLAASDEKTSAGKASSRFVTPAYVGYRWSSDRMRFLEQATFGPNATFDSRLRRIGIRAWISDQFSSSYPSVSNPYPAQPLKPASAPADCDGDQTVVPDVPVTCQRDTYSMYQPQTWFFREAFYGDAQLRHRVTWALAQLWVTSGVDIQQGRHMVEYYKILSKNAFGNYRNLMKDMTLSPTMGDYLSMSQSTKTNPNENYAREIMQLFTVGLFMLNQDGTLQKDASNNPIDTYDQNVVNNMTRVMTGWTFCQTAGTCPNIASGSVNYIDPMLLNSGNHDLNAKTLLAYNGSTTTTIPACAAPCTTVAARTTYANASLDQALDNIFNHPNLGPYVSKVLIQQLVTSDPTPAYVGRVTAKFNNNGSGVRGDMQAVIKAILTDVEARGDVKTDPHFGKLREPVLLTTGLLRAFNVASADGLSQTDGYLTGRGEFTGMAQTPFMSPTVFNFYPPGYVIPGTTTPGPEFAIMNTGTAIQRANFVNRFVFTAPAIPVASPNSPNGLSIALSDLQALSAADSTGGQLVDELNRRLLHNTMSAAMKSTIQTAVTSIAATDTLNRSRQALYLVATSSQYQVQR